MSNSLLDRPSWLTPQRAGELIAQRHVKEIVVPGLTEAIVRNQLGGACIAELHRNVLRQGPGEGTSARDHSG